MDASGFGVNAAVRNATAITMRGSKPQDHKGDSAAGIDADGIKVRVPSKVIGLLLDHGHASAAAIRLAFFKALHGPTWSLNQRQLAKPAADGGLGMGERQFYGGVALMRRAGVLIRGWGGRLPGGRRAFARETVKAVDGGYVELPESLVRSDDSKLAPFVAAILLPPTPQDARDVAHRIGLSRRSKNAIKRLVEGAGNHIAAVRARGSWIVGRPGTLVQNVEVQSVEVQNDKVQNVDEYSVPVDAHRNPEDWHRILQDEHRPTLLALRTRKRHLSNTMPLMQSMLPGYPIDCSVG